MTAKIIEVLYTKHIIGEYSLFEILERAGYKDYAIQSTIDKLTTDIESLYRPKIDKLNKRIEFQVEANDTLLLQVREMEKEILKLKKIIAAQDELYKAETDLDIIQMSMESSHLPEFTYSPKYRELEKNESNAISKCNELKGKITQLKKEAGI